MIKSNLRELNYLQTARTDFFESHFFSYSLDYYKTKKKVKQTRHVKLFKKVEIYDQVSMIAYLISIGNSIPHYCYHNELAVVGNCRVCIVEIQTAKKPVVACTAEADKIKGTPEQNGIAPYSPLVLTSREAMLEFLLLNHPLDCPVCDQGGDCDLQDQVLFWGSHKRKFYTKKRIVSDKDLGPIVKTVMTRCIHCTRCIRFLNDIVGTHELGMLGRGNKSEIGTFIERPLLSELSGNIIDICPVGLFEQLPPFFRKEKC